MAPLVLLVPLVAVAFAAMRKRAERGHVTIQPPIRSGAAPLPLKGGEFPATGRVNKPAAGRVAPRPRNQAPSKPTPVDAPKVVRGVDGLPVRSPGLPTGSKPTPAAPIGVVPGGPSPDLLARMAAVLASADVAAIRALAKEMRTRGWDEQADDLDKAADAIELATKLPTLPGLPPGLVPPPWLINPPSAAIPNPINEVPKLPVPVPVKDIPKAAPKLPPPMVTPSEPYDPDPRRNLALKVQRMLALSPKGSEDTALLKQWQTQEGCKPADGLYGYCSGIAMLKYKLVPPKPRTTLSAANRKKWTDNLNWQARVDPPRAAEYQAAAKLD